MKRLFLFFAVMLIITWLISAVAFISKKNDVTEKRLELVLRNIGHQLLLHAKDSTSKVMPVKKINENIYQLSFQYSFNFMPDTLISLVQQQLQTNNLPNHYIVTVKDCEQKQTMYAYEINPQSKDIIPCKGREQEKACYLIQVEFIQKAGFNFSLLLLLLIPVGFAVYYFKSRYSKKPVITEVATDIDFIELGNFKFYATNNVLKEQDTIIPLSEKETKALQIFAENINQVIEREKMMKAIWEDEGIVVMSRNVDVLVSKLRKKLSTDSSIKITNVHGRGYKFIIDEGDIPGLDATA